MNQITSMKPERRQCSNGEQTDPQQGELQQAQCRCRPDGYSTRGDRIGFPVQNSSLQKKKNKELTT